MIIVMNSIKKIGILVVLILLALPACSCLKNAGNSSTRNTVNLVNLLIEELSKQDFDIAATTPKENKYHVDALINDRKVSMILDTGAAFSILKLQCYKDCRLIKSHVFKNNAVRLKPCFADYVEMFPAMADSFSIGSISFSPWPFLVSHESMYDGFLGAEFLAMTNAVFICNPGIVCITLNQKPADNLGSILKQHSYKEIELLQIESDEYDFMRRQFGEEQKSIKGGVLVAPVTFNELSGYSAVDTGSPFTIIDSTKFGRKIFGTKTYSRIVISDAKGTKRNLRSFILYNYMIGDCKISNHFETAFMEMSDKKNMSLLGIIGLDVLYKNNAIIDFGNKKLYLQAL